LRAASLSLFWFACGYPRLRAAALGYEPVETVELALPPAPLQKSLADAERPGTNVPAVAPNAADNAGMDGCVPGGSASE
jgi:hypothetical protein